MKLVSVALSATLAIALVSCFDSDSVESSAALAAPAPVLPAPVRSRVPDEQQQALLAQAAADLDASQGDSALLESAVVAIDQVLAANPHIADAHYQKGRYHFYSSYINGSRHDRERLEDVEKELDAALEIDPKFADAIVLRGFLRSAQGYKLNAIKELKAAEALGIDSPWIDIYLAQVYADLKEWDNAASRLQNLETRIAGKETAKRVLVALAARSLEVHEGRRDLTAITAAHQKLLELVPDSAWGHGNYASHLLLELGDTDSALAEAEKALSLMEYPLGRRTMGLIQYAKWAATPRSKAGAAKAFLEQAQAYLPELDDVMASAASHVDRNPDLRRLAVKLLGEGVSIDAVDSNGHTGMSFAACCGSKEAIAWLVKNGADVNLSSRSGYTPLAVAVANHRVDVAIALMSHGADVSAGGGYGRPPLHLAIEGHHKELVSQLISNGADVNAEASAGDTPLMGAASMGDRELVELLVSAGADPNLRSSNGGSPAVSAARGGHNELAAWLRAQDAATVKAG